MSVDQEKALKEQLKALQEKRRQKEGEQARNKKTEEKRIRQEKELKLQATVKAEKARKKAENIRIQKKQQDAKKLKEQERLNRYEKRRAEEARQHAEKKRLQAERHAASLIREEREARIADAKLKREVVVEFDIKSIKPILEEAMQKFGEIEQSRMSPFGFCVRYKTEEAAQQARKKRKIMAQLASTVVPQEIKRNAVHFEAPQEMGDLDDELLSQVKDALGAYGAVANIKRRNRFVIIFFENKESAESLAGGGDEVTIEMGGHTVALLQGVPASPRKRSQAIKRAKAEARKAELANKSTNMKH